MDKKHESKRHIVQTIAAVLCNLHAKGLLTGSLYRGKLKGVCVPGLNCYSCPAAVGSCPLGALQSVIGTLRTKVNGYVIGILMLYGALFGRLICGWLCPFGLLQEILHKIPVPKPHWHPGKLKYLKYAVLAVFVVGIPLYTMIDKGMGIPAFCKYLCPQGTIAGLLLAAADSAYRGMIGSQFIWKAIVLGAVLSAAAALYRPFCRVLCPLGALYGLFNSFSLVHLELDRTRCRGCGACLSACPMDVNVVRGCNDAECIRCGKCAKSCKNDALHFRCGWKGSVPDDVKKQNAGIKDEI